jgi:hypothetical protein
VIELKSYKFKDGTVIAIFHERVSGHERWSVGQFDKSDIMMWEDVFEHEEEAWTEFYKRVAENPIDQRTGAKR